MVPEGWSITKLSDLADVKRGAGSQYLTYVDEPDEGIRLIRIGDFLGDNPKFVSHTSDMDRFILKKDDILIAGTGATAGITFEVPEHFEGYAFSYNAPRIRPKKHVDKVFLVNFLKSNEITKQQRSLFTGNAQPFLDTKAIGGFKILTPPLPEQQKIADILSTWDAAIEKTEALLATAKAQKRALMQSLLTGKRRFPEFEGQPWKEVRLGDVFSRVRRRNTVGNDNVLTISAQHGLVSQEKYFNKRVAAKDLSGYTLLHHGDFAYNKSYSRGYPLGAIKMLEIDEPGVVSSLYLCFALTDKSSNCREYFRHFFEAGRFNHEIYKIAQEGARNHGLLNVSSTDFFRAQVSVPPLAEQRKIAAVLNCAEDQIAEHAQSVEKLRTEKKALMQQLLTGKRRVVVDA
ncbi:restriction endonuclease subunit S [Actibacterium lipolyticum]|uniref:Type-1 restriction enzyme EcoKI specificity protein n=1 Tax=Actibacterium lipolyticum TaxID=1524263 RepID=A0A238JX92_9RHOB|nr:restriction endonuclease subunit S [Actibacterium lipolyticum]SMX35278.1 Type-1 restriction enzyme EcoKI specificity protein [Actibacterium lipolyticum]